MVKATDKNRDPERAFCSNTFRNHRGWNNVITKAGITRLLVFPAWHFRDLLLQHQYVFLSSHPPLVVTPPPYFIDISRHFLCQEDFNNIIAIPIDLQEVDNKSHLNIMYCRILA